MDPLRHQLTPRRGAAVLRGTAARAARLGLLAAALLATTFASGLGGCAREEAPGAAPAAPGVVDSALPIPVLLARFRAATPDTPTTLTGGAPTPRALVARLLAALERRDSVEVRRLVLTRGEFAWLWYPHTRFTAPPYALGPDLVWLTHRAASDKGERRLLERLGGRRLALRELACDEPPVDEGPHRLLPGCVVRYTADEGPVESRRLFGALLLRDGRYKFLSYVNDY